MSYTLSDAKSVLHKTLYASTAYEVLQLIQLTLVTLALTKQDAAQYALLICSTTIVGKFFDAGLGAAVPRLLKTTPHQARALFNVIVQQACLIVPIVALIFACTAKTSGSIILAIIFCAGVEGFATLSRHAGYSTLQSDALMCTEVGIKALLVMMLIPLYLLNMLTIKVLVVLFVFFLVCNTAAIAFITWYQVMRESRPPNKLYAALMHKTVAKLRLQTFSTKISKDLLSIYALTPIFAFFHGAEHTWLFFFLTSIITSLHTIIKMTVGYTAAGTFAKLPESTHAVALRRLNHYLFLFIGGAMLFTILAYAMAPAFYLFIMAPISLPQQALTALFYVVCYSVITFADLAPLAYEQYLLVTGHYTTYQRMRIFEYACLGVLAIVFLHAYSVLIATSIMLCCKIGIFLAIRKRATALLRKAAKTAATITPAYSTLTIGYTPAYMHEIENRSNSQAGVIKKHEYW